MDFSVVMLRPGLERDQVCAQTLGIKAAQEADSWVPSLRDPCTQPASTRAPAAGDLGQGSRAGGSLHQHRDDMGSSGWWALLVTCVCVCPLPHCPECVCPLPSLSGRAGSAGGALVNRSSHSEARLPGPRPSSSLHTAISAPGDDHRPSDGDSPCASSDAPWPSDLWPHLLSKGSPERPTYTSLSC